jgi:hypothetical protein
MGKITGRYITTTVTGESVRAFVPNALPPRLSTKTTAELREPLRVADAALSKLAYSGHGRPPFRLMPDQDSG